MNYEDEQIKMLADNLWKYFEPKTKEISKDKIAYFRATVTAPASGGKITIRKPFDNTTMVVRCAGSATGLRVGDQCVVMQMGNASNCVAVSDGTMSTFGGGGGGGGEPAAYIKSASVSQDGNTLTLTKKDNTTVQFAPAGSGGTSDHTHLTNRDAAKQHPISAITGLQSALDGKGTYSKPSGGIPKADLASAVQTSLGLADTALQSYTETDPVFSASAAHGISSSDISNWNSKGTYSKPSGGIPKADLASAVQSSLNKADSALQSVPSGYAKLTERQTFSKPQMIVGNDADGDGSGQPALLKVVYDGNAGTGWQGRTIVGAKNLTFLLGTYNGMAGIGAHSWQNVLEGTGAAWADFYLNPDGNKAVYIGGSGWTAGTGILKVDNSDSKVYYNGAEIAKKNEVPQIQYSATDIGEGAPLATGTFYFVYEE